VVYPSRASDGGGGGGGGLPSIDESTPLIFPPILLATEQAAARELLQSLPPTLAQTVLDELGGTQRQMTVHSPLAYLARLAAKAAQGTFVPTVAIRVARSRAVAPTTPSVAAPQPAPTPKEQGRVQLARLKEMMRGGAARIEPPAGTDDGVLEPSAVLTREF